MSNISERFVANLSANSLIGILMPVSISTEVAGVYRSL
jgi:hypothetical protein